MSSLVNFLSDNAKQVDAHEAEEKLRRSEPKLLDPDERVVFAFKDRGGRGRDSSFFTTLRVLVKDRRGLTGKKINYRSIPYHNIQAWRTETAGSLDSDTELNLWSKGFGVTAFEYVKSQVKLFDIHQFLNQRVFSSFSLSLCVCVCMCVYVCVC